MNVRHLAAPLAMGGIAVCAAAVALTVTGAFGISLFEPPPSGVAAAGETVETVGDDAGDGGVMTVDVPVTEPFDTQLVSIEEQSEYMGREQVIAECMAERGVEYLPAAPWLNQDRQPRGLSYEQSIAWLNAFFGEAREPWSVPTSEWQRRGCVGVGDHAVAVARAAGTPLSAPIPEPDPDALTEAEELALFHEAIDACMAEKGFDTAGVAAGEWHDAMYGNPGLGAAYRWQDAGCHGYAVHVTGNTH